METFIYQSNLSNLCICPLIDDKMHYTLSKCLWNDSAANFDNVMAKFTLSNMTDAWKTDINLFFTKTRPEAGQMPGLNKVLKGKSDAYKYLICIV